MLSKIKLSKLILNIDRWLLNNIFDRKRIFEVRLSDCVDEFGNTFGKNGSHFFILALKKGEDFDSASNFLSQYYKDNRIVSFNEEIDCEIESIECQQYFCPWEEDRVRPLKKFNKSHKIGPTDSQYLPKIVSRLLCVLNLIKSSHLPSWRLLDGYPRVIKIIDKKQTEIFLIRDGNHRLSVYSYLGFDSIKVSYDADHWRPSKLFRLVYKLIKKHDYRYSHHLKTVKEIDVDSWPHVISGNVKSNDAIKFFQSRFGSVLNSRSKKNYL